MSSFSLKMLAIITMLIDHTGSMLIPEGTPLYWLFRSVGRIAYPIFAFLIVEGFYHTKNVKKYMLRLAAFALISELPFNLLHDGKLFDTPESYAQNVFFTLLAGLAAIYFINKYSDRRHIALLFILPLIIAAEIAHTDYGAIGIVMILFYNTFRDNRKLAVISVGALNIIYATLGALTTAGYVPVQALAAAAAIPVYFYNGKKGPSLKYAFYAFYPLHMLALYGIKQFFLAPTP